MRPSNGTSTHSGSQLCQIILKSIHKYIYLLHKSQTHFNPLPNDNILDQSKLKAFAGDKLKVIHVAKIVPDKIETIVGKEENAGYQHFLLFPQCFQKAFSLGSLKVGIVW